ncbi:hypothetical protein BDA99DRAFT_520755 [Phascolomyces articulosus]|uniref:Uncharacterized protein n=1 Tax=Phascolomyces articulosus TaxID=60185 RepID=A0AAD5JSI3_9FUNG|nr:hypothetical protein BDA99DRAFT_520755 [Phascolomyces articulosus]
MISEKHASLQQPQSSQQSYRRKKRQYPPSIPAATLWATDCYPYVKRRMPVAPLIRLSGIDRLPPPTSSFQDSYSSPEYSRRPQTPPPAYKSTLPPRYEEVVHNRYSEDDDIPLAQIRKRHSTLMNHHRLQDEKTEDDEHETLDRVQQRLKSVAAYNVTKQ